MFRGGGLPMRVRLRRTVRDLACILGLLNLLGAFSYAAEIEIHLINAKDGTPVDGVPVWLYLGDEKPLGKPLSATTGSDGTALFRLPDPLPKSVFVVEEVSGKIGGCSSTTFSLSEVIERGVVGDTKYGRCDPKGKLRGKFVARPGEIILFVRFLRWWERMQT